MTSKGGVGVTVIGHDSESRTKVDGYEKAGSYERNVTYVATMDQIVSVIKQSAQCEQFIKYECHFSELFDEDDGWWVSRQGKKMNYWGGAAVDSGKCGCAMNNNCYKGYDCNCDANDGVLREDSGFLMDTNTLPVKQLRFGDTGSSHEWGFHTLGKLLCWE
ncbi:neurexin-4-like [Dendronephthya gigantea]|uniref:neurexin-4-like n=1 Tax=Dendronephthya gigantea TaxID=151771 RepID=UPI00106B0B89|nr:neurexin-4-like [Dendronephthya gigantea]